MTNDKAALDISNRRAVVAVLVCFLPFVALGPYSFVRVHDNGDTVLPYLINLANQAEIWGGSGFWSWFPFQAAGVPTFTQGFINLYQIPFFIFLPDWLAYQVLVLTHGALAGLCLYKLLREAFGVVPETAGWFAAVYAVLGYKLGMIMNLPNAWTFPLVYIFWRFSKSHGLYLQTAFCLGIGVAFGVIASSFFLISFHFLTVCVLLVVLATSIVRGLILAAFFFVGLLAGNAPEITSLLSVSSDAHRSNWVSPEFWDVVAYLFTDVISIQVVICFLGVMIFRIWSGQTRLLIIWWLLIIAFYIVMPIANDIFPKWIQGVNLARLVEPVRDLSFIIAPLVIAKILQGSNFPWLRNQSWIRLGLQNLPILIMIFGIASYYIAHSRTFIETGGFSRYHFDFLKRLSEKNDKMPGAFRVESLHYPGGSGFLSAYGLESIGGYLTLYSRRYQEFFSRVILPQGSGEPITPLPPYVANYLQSSSNHLDVNCYHKSDYQLDLAKCLNLDLLALTNVQYVFSRHTLLHPDLKLLEGSKEAWASFDTVKKVAQAASEIFGAPPHIQLYELKKVLPRVYVPNSVDVFSDNSGVLKALKLRKVASFRERAIVSNSDLTNKMSEDEFKGLSGPGEAGRVVSFKFSNDTMIVTVDMRRKGLVVVTNAYHPAWTAQIDGKATNIYPVFHAFWSVVAPKGRHVIIFQFGKATV